MTPDRPPGGDPIQRATITLATLIALTTTTATATTNTTQQLRHSTDVVEFFQNHQWLRAPRQPSCLEVPWTRSCRIARRVYTYHHQRIAKLKQRLWREIPATNDWLTSVRLAQRVYPGTDDWLIFISRREGGWGPFVMNHQGSGAGGWLQFMASTFYAYSDDARSDVARRGFKVPSNVWDWHHPLGQALTGAYMRFTGRDGCHWCL